MIPKCDSTKFFKSVRALEERSPLVPVVAIIDQKPIALDIGNQYVTYRIETKRGDVLFFEVHLMGVDELTIEGVKELSSKEVTDRLRGRKMFKVEQQKQ